MIACWLLLGAAVLLWPLPRMADLRLSRLAGAARLAGVERTARPSTAIRHWRGPALGGRVWLAAAGVAGVGAGLLWDAPVGVVVAVVAATAARLAVRARARRRDSAGLRQLATALRLLCAELEAGSAVESALAAAGEVAGRHAPVFAATSAAAAGGEDVAASLARSADPVLRPVADAWQVSALTGAPLAGVLARVERDLAARLEQSREVAAALAGPRASAALLAGLPVLGVALGAAMGAHPLAMLLGTPAGHLVLCAGVLLDALGLLWTARLVASAERS